MQNACLVMQASPALRGTAELSGAKNAVLVIMASLILTRGKSLLRNVPNSSDVKQMITLLQLLGAHVTYVPCMQTLYVDTTTIDNWHVPHTIMKQMRASILVMGPLLARFGKASIAMPGGCVIGARPINYHLTNFAKMGVLIEQHDEQIEASVLQLKASKLLLDYPSVGATENSIMLAVLTAGTTKIINAALEPEVLDLIEVLKKMGAQIEIAPPATIIIQGVTELQPIEHAVLYDRLEAGALLIATAMTGGILTLPQAPVHALEFLLYKLQEMGHRIVEGPDHVGVTLYATNAPRAVSFKTGPYPGFPTDLQAPMMAAQLLADGVSTIEETVFENRLLHVPELQKMGAQIKVMHNKAIVTGVEKLYGSSVIATDIRASTALVLAGLCAHGVTMMYGLHHWERGYDSLQKKLQMLGAQMHRVGEYDALMMRDMMQQELL